MRKFGEAGINATTDDTKDDDEYKSDVLAEFDKAGHRYSNGISATDILTKGFDQTDDWHIGAAVEEKHFESRAAWSAVMRTHPGKEQAICVIQDIPATGWFAESWDNLCTSMARNRLNDADKKPEPSDKEKTAAKCPRCSALWPAHSDTMRALRLVRERKSAVVEVAGEMREIGARQKQEKYSPEYKRDFTRSFWDTPWRVATIRAARITDTKRSSA